ncbi:xanthine dehydrogenase family protein subunit M [Leptospira sp. severe_002]|uniref:FAD binding domain-containing protein n=1 Tax=Leptospira sp. severe_002 TaxID=2838237 RepID=UPI001E62C1E4|nr:xanthine dehydrogenase family protein subunit M [Leptospira sp. severe_002]
MKLPAFEYACPNTLSEAVALLASHDGDAKALAGGQSLMPMMAFRVAQPSLLVDLRKIPDLKGIRISSDGVRLGALTRWRDIQDDKALAKAQPLLAAAIAHVAHYQIRNRGTVGGSLAHADPAAEMPGVAVTCDAEIVVMGKGGARTIKAADFFLGALTTALEPDEIITEVRLPFWPVERRYGFQEFARRRGDFAMSGVALFYDLDKSGKAANAHVGVIGVGEHARRLLTVEATINGNKVDDAVIAKAAAAASAAVEPNDDIHASAAYRKALTGTLVERALKAAAA